MLQSMVVGQNGLNGKSVVQHVGKESNQGIEHVQIQYQMTEENIVLEMIPKLICVIQGTVQVNITL